MFFFLLNNFAKSLRKRESRLIFTPDEMDILTLKNKITNENVFKICT